MSKSESALAKITPPFVLLSAALLLWSGAVTLSGHLARAPESLSHGRGGAARMGAPAVEGDSTPQLSEGLQQLKTSVEANPSDVTARLEYARALRVEAYAKEDGELLMETVRAFSAVLDLEKEHPEALLSLASLCLEAGIIDKALTLYPRYLTQRPDDWRAKVDYSLALLHADRAKEALPMLDEIARSQPELFQVRFAQALAYKLSGDLEAARAAAGEAAKRAPDEEANARLTQFIESLDSPVKDVGRSGPSGSVTGAATSASNSAPETVSPAKVVAEYFQAHPIVGPKLKGISWPELNRAHVAVENFPVEQMPEFAKAKFLSGAKAYMKTLPSKVTISLVDATSKKELLSFEVGGGEDGE